MVEKGELVGLWVGQEGQSGRPLVQVDGQEWAGSQADGRWIVDR